MKKQFKVAYAKWRKAIKADPGYHWPHARALKNKGRLGRALYIAIVEHGNYGGLRFSCGRHLKSPTGKATCKLP